MSFVRPAVARTIKRWREAITAGLLVLAGMWLAALGGWLLLPLGGIVAATGLAWVVIALRRIRFHRGVSAPGIVELDEGQLGYFGPTFGGFLALDDIVELRLTQMQEARQWRLKTRANEVLLIPTTAAGAEKLFDAFAALPGIDMAAVTAALDADANPSALWQRPKAGSIPKLLDHELS